jgi:hypothetical protein
MNPDGSRGIMQIIEPTWAAYVSQLNQLAAVSDAVKQQVVAAMGCGGRWRACLSAMTSHCELISVAGTSRFPVNLRVPPAGFEPAIAGLLLEGAIR